MVVFKHNRMDCHNNSDTQNDLEGVRQMLLMLSKGPQAFSVQATLELPQLSAASCPDANAWMKAGKRSERLQLAFTQRLWLRQLRCRTWWLLGVRV